MHRCISSQLEKVPPNYGRTEEFLKWTVLLPPFQNKSNCPFSAEIWHSSKLAFLYNSRDCNVGGDPCLFAFMACLILMVHALWSLHRIFGLQIQEEVTVCPAEAIVLYRGPVHCLSTPLLRQCLCFSNLVSLTSFLLSRGLITFLFPHWKSDGHVKSIPYGFLTIPLGRPLKVMIWQG